MFVKKVRLEGFRSYKSHEMQEYDFSNGQNLIVGLNGYGKSNILLAIEFVFSDKFDKLGLDEKL